MSRRTLLLGGTSGLAVVLVGCARPDALGGSSSPEPSSTSEPGPGNATDADVAPDVVSAGRALEAVRGVRDLLQEVLTTFPGLAAALTPVVAMHSAHELALAGAVPTGPTLPQEDPSASPGAGDGEAPGSRVPEARAQALELARGREESLRDDLAALAAQAESGAFAQLLASMSAAVAQRAARWPS